MHFVMLRRMALLVFTAGTLCSQPLSGADGPNRLTDTNGPARRPIDEAYGTLPLIFEANRGQAAEPVRFLARGVGYRLLLSPTDAVLHMASAPQDPGASLRMRFSGADPRAAFIGLDEQPGKVNYFVGKDASRWRTGIPAYARVAVKSVYPGVDLVYYGNQHHLEYDFIIEPGADPRAINLAFEGASRVIVDGRGDVVLQVGEGAVRLRKPVAYQDIDGRRRPIDARFVQRTARQIALAVGRYDRRLPLIIDPELVYSTVFGGSRYNVGQAVAVDADGNAYVTGWTDADFPVTNWIDGSSRGYGGDVFVTKFDPTGRALVFSTIVGGAAGQDQPRGIGVDAAGNVYVAGETMSYDFPTTPGAVQPTCSLGACPPAPSIGFQDGFAFKLDP